MGHRVSYAAALGAAVVLLVGGCSDEPEPKFADPTSEVPTSTGAEPVTEPPTSEPTVEPRPESAQAFAKRWVEVSDRMQVTGDTGEYLRLATSDCKPCRDTAALVSGYFEAGGGVTFAGTKVLRVREIGRIGDTVELEVQVDSAPTRYTEEAGGPVRTLDGGRNSTYLKLKQSSGGWLVVSHGVYAS